MGRNILLAAALQWVAASVERAGFGSGTFGGWPSAPDAIRVGANPSLKGFTGGNEPTEAAGCSRQYHSSRHMKPWPEHPVLPALSSFACFHHVAPSACHILVLWCTHSHLCACPCKTFMFSVNLMDRNLWPRKFANRFSNLSVTTMVESVQAWLEELAHTQTLCQARPGLADNKPSAKALMDMYQALEKSTLSNHHVKALQERLDFWSQQPEGPLKAQMMPQQLDHIYNFLTKQDWIELKHQEGLCCLAGSPCPQKR